MTSHERVRQAVGGKVHINNIADPFSCDEHSAQDARRWEKDHVVVKASVTVFYMDSVVSNKPFSSGEPIHLQRTLAACEAGLLASEVVIGCDAMLAGRAISAQRSYSIQYVGRLLASLSASSPVPSLGLDRTALDRAALWQQLLAGEDLDRIAALSQALQDPPQAAPPVLSEAMDMMTRVSQRALAGAQLT